MTLVIYQKQEENIFLCGDMKMTWDVGLQSPPIIQNWMTKVIILSPSLCLAWAGEFIFASRALIEIWNLPEMDMEGIAKVLLRYHLESSNRTDFILVRNTGKALLIRDGKLADISKQELEFIGNEDLFRRYSSESFKFESEGARLIFFRLGDVGEETKTTPLQRITSRMYDLSEINCFPLSSGNIGHVLTPVSGSSTQGFKYHLYVVIEAPKSSSPTDEWTAVDLGSIPTGGYAYEISSRTMLGHQFITYKNLHNNKIFCFSDYRKGIPMLSTDAIHLPPERK